MIFSSHRFSVPGRDRILFVGICLLLAVWSGWFIWRTSFPLGESRFFCLFDDAMISMTYARNLVEGFGLNWARHGLPVEGFSCPLWVAVMVITNLSPVPLPQQSLLIQILSLALLGINLGIIRRLVSDHFSAGDHRHWLAPALLTATYYPLNYWALMGMETALQAFLTNASVLTALNIERSGARQGLRLGALLALGYLTRMDFLLIAAAILGYLAWRKSWRRLLPALWLLGATIAVYQGFRWLYFRDVLPNTYYLKLTGFPLDLRILHGAAVSADFLLPAMLAIGVMILGVLQLGRKHPQFVLAAVLPLLSVAYSIYVGGDSWEHGNLGANRFIAFTVPLLFVVLGGLGNHLLAGLDSRPWLDRQAALVCRRLLVLAALFVGLQFNGLGPGAGARDRWQEYLVLKRPFLVTSHHLVASDVAVLKDRYPPGARVATAWAGIPAYFTDFLMVDVLGYNDRHIARLPAVPKLTIDTLDRYVPGHMKWDLQYTLTVGQPDVIYQVWGVTEEQLQSILPAHGYVQDGRFWVREFLLDQWHRDGVTK